ncbi:MAG: ATP-grasp domain-containing protein [Thermoplasmatota archaeon]
MRNGGARVVLATMNHAGMAATDPMIAAFAEDLAISNALAELGVAASITPWDVPDPAWNAAELCVVRSTWDYHQRADEFLAWTHDISRQCDLWNREETIQANLHKGYLLELAARGVPIPPTILLRRGHTESATAIAERRGWDRFVIKPAVGASSEGQWRGRPHEGSAADQHLAALLDHGDALLQPYLDSIETAGETSIIFVDGQLSHAVNKQPAMGDYRANPVLGASVQRVVPSEEMLAVALGAMSCVPEATLYARVDLAQLRDGMPALMELELIEPLLFLAYAPESVALVAQAIKRRLRR